MKLHSDFAAQRPRQVTVDVVALLLIAVSTATGIAVFSTVNQLAQFGRENQSCLQGVPQVVAGLVVRDGTAENDHEGFGLFGDPSQVSGNVLTSRSAEAAPCPSQQPRYVAAPAASYLLHPPTFFSTIYP